MSILPIVGRELRVASRKRSTFWVRVIAALVAVMIASGFLLLSLVSSLGFGTAGLGVGLFAGLTWMCLPVALSAGIFFTSDCLSQEKREGTLGFLFLTDLRGHDVVLGKLAATSMRSLHALLAVLPVLGVCLIMGGVSGEQFLKTALALLNALLLSLTAGLFVSALCRDSQRAFAGTILLITALAASGPSLDSILAAAANLHPGLSLSSPVMLFYLAGQWNQPSFWTALGVNQFVTWTLLGLACVLLPRLWQERAPRGLTAADGWVSRLKYGGPAVRVARRERLLGLNPALWLACRERWPSLLMWTVTLFLAAGAAVAVLAGESMFASVIWNSVNGLFSLLLYLALASQAGRFFVETRLAGLLELVAVTPLGVRRIVSGQWRALVRRFGVPLALCLTIQLVGAFLSQEQMWDLTGGVTTTTTVTVGTNSVTATNTAPAPIVTGTTGTSAPFSSEAPPDAWFMIMLSVVPIIAMAADLVALAWFGMWMGLTSKTNNLATLKTLLFVVIIPTFVITFVSALAMPLVILPTVIGGKALDTNAMLFWFPLIAVGLSTLLSTGKDVFFIIWARRKLHQEFESRVLQPVVPNQSVPPVLPTGPAPPVLRPA